MLTDSQGSDIIMERDPQTREEMVAKLTEEEAKDFIIRLLRVMHGEFRTGFPEDL